MLGLRAHRSEHLVARPHATYILGLRDCLQVFGIDAAAVGARIAASTCRVGVVAKMVDLMARGDSTNPDPVSKPIHTFSGASAGAVLEQPVSRLIGAAQPEPAPPVDFVESGDESVEMVPTFAARPFPHEGELQQSPAPLHMVVAIHAQPTGSSLTTTSAMEADQSVAKARGGGIPGANQGEFCWQLVERSQLPAPQVTRRAQPAALVPGLFATI